MVKVTSRLEILGDFSRTQGAPRHRALEPRQCGRKQIWFQLRVVTVGPRICSQRVPWDAGRSDSKEERECLPRARQVRRGARGARGYSEGQDAICPPQKTARSPQVTELLEPAPRQTPPCLAHKSAALVKLPERSFSLASL